jgi:peroxiredoxin
MKRTAHTPVLLLALIAAAYITAGCGAGSASDPDLRASGAVVEGIQKGDRLPDAQLTTFSGEPIRISELKGQPLIVNFWATWCGPCNDEIPMLEEAYKANSGSGLQLVAITDEQKDEVEPFMQSHEMTFPVLLDPRKRVNNAYQVIAIPTTFFLDRNGIIVERHLGALGPNLLKVYLEKIMASPAEPSATPGAAPGTPTPAPATIPTRRPSATPLPLVPPRQNTGHVFRHPADL